MGEPVQEADAAAEDVFAIAAEHYAADYESRTSCLWPFVILPLLVALLAGGIGYAVYSAVSR